MPLLELDLAIEPDLEQQRGEAQSHRRREGLVSADRVRRDGFRYRLLDLGLRTHADRLQELADAEVEDLLVVIASVMTPAPAARRPARACAANACLPRICARSRRRW